MKKTDLALAEQINAAANGIGEKFTPDVMRSILLNLNDSKSNRCLSISKTDHGFTLNDVLTYKSSAWNKFAEDDNWLGIVRRVVSDDEVEIVMRGELMTGLSGLTAGTIYYIQDDATIGTDVSNDPLFMAISATEAILF